MEVVPGDYYKEAAKEEEYAYYDCGYKRKVHQSSLPISRYFWKAIVAIKFIRA